MTGGSSVSVNRREALASHGHLVAACGLLLALLGAATRWPTLAQPPGNLPGLTVRLPRFYGTAGRRSMSSRIQRPRRIILLPLLLTTCLALGACGDSSTSRPSSANAAAAGAGDTSSPARGDTSSARGATSSARGATSSARSSTSSARVSASPAGGSASSEPATRESEALASLRECLQRNGVTLSRQDFQHLPRGVNREKYEAALRKCGLHLRSARSLLAEKFRNPVFTHAVTAFAACLREHGINIPAPNTSGAPPIFNTRGIDTGSPQFASAVAKCRGKLAPAFRAGAAHPRGSR
jgi:hypothetical protein